MFKKIFVLLFAFLVLNIITVYQFDYADNMDRKDIFSKIYDETKSIFVSKDIKTQNLFFEITKDKNSIKISGFFKDEKELDKITDFLKIDKSDNISFKDGIITDFQTFEEIKPLIEKMKDMFDDSVKLSFKNAEFYLKGDLIDENYKSLLESILLSIKLPIKNDIKIAPLQIEIDEPNPESLDSEITQDVVKRF
jgi:OmpA-OmpF porin, OOP family